MLELRPTCENCQTPLPPDSLEAMICTYECTFCKDCVENVLHNVCPNCSGGFTPRPVRPKQELIGNPASTRVVDKPINKEKFAPVLAKNKDIPPEKR